jgi:tRNA 2-thiouridine synthesizing protein E
MELNVDGDGFLIDPNDWNEEVMYELARKDGLELNKEHIKYIMDARKMYEVNGTVPPIREFAKSYGMDRKAKPLYALFESGVMKRIAKYAALPKPTGCI